MNEQVLKPSGTDSGKKPYGVSGIKPPPPPLPLPNLPLCVRGLTCHPSQPSSSLTVNLFQTGHFNTRIYLFSAGN